MIRPPLVALALACLLATSACTDAGKEVQAAIPAPSPSPSPTPELTPVEGAVDFRALDTSRLDKLGFADDGPPPEGSVKQAAAAVAAMLDEYLNLAQRDDADLAVIRGLWLEEANPEGAELLRSGLATEEDPVRSASYEIVVQVEPAPTLATTRVTIQRARGSTVHVQMVFDLTSDERPRLQLVGGGEGF